MGSGDPATAGFGAITAAVQERGIIDCSVGIASFGGPTCRTVPHDICVCAWYICIFILHMHVYVCMYM